MLFTNILASVATFATYAAAFSNPLPCSGVCVNTHDPAMIRRESDGTYYRFATGAGIPIHSAPSIQGPWTYLGEILPQGSSIDNSGADDAWAPDVSLVDGTYYAYYSVSTFGTQNSAIGVATSKTLEPGSWTDHGSTGVESSTGDPYNAIDGNLLVTDNAHVFTFGSFWGDIYQTTLTGDALAWYGDAPLQVEYNQTAPMPSEGPFLFPFGNYFYLFWSSGKCCGYDSDMPAPGEEYKIMVCRSPSEFGPFEDAEGTPCNQSGGTLVLGTHDLVYGPGGQGVYEDPEMGSVLYYHYVDTSIGFGDGDKQLGINVIDWSSGWPVV